MAARLLILSSDGLSSFFGPTANIAFIDSNKFLIAAWLYLLNPSRLTVLRLAPARRKILDLEVL